MRKKFYTITAAIGDITQGKDKQLPGWYLIFPAGVTEIEGEGSYIVDEQSWQFVKARLARRGVDVVVDYEHQTMAGAKAPAAGWATDWRWSDKGIEAKINWTEEAKAYVARREYRYYSPVFLVRKSDRRLAGVHSIALTNAPKTNHLKPLLAKLGAQLEEENDMDLKLLIAKLGLKKDATAVDVLAAIDALKKKTVTAKEVIPAEVVTALGAEDSDLSTVVASIHALRQTEKTMVSREDFDQLQAKLTKRDASEAVAAAMNDGKITPDQQTWAEKYAERDLDGSRQGLDPAADALAGLLIEC